jgi:pimeloyl-ACP methyl ester carboxylesterase
MSAAISVSRDQVMIRTSFLGGILGFNRNITFDAKNVIKFSVSEQPPKQEATRVFGLHIPFVGRIGMHYSFRSRTWEYWNVSDYWGGNKARYYEFYLKNEGYNRIVIKSDDDRVVEKMKSLDFSKYWDFGQSLTTVKHRTIRSSNHHFTASIVAPIGRTPKAGMLLIQGSGPTDKDWNSPGLGGSNGSGKIIAELLAREGYCTLAFDKIGTPGNSHTGPISWSDYLEDQRAALAALREEVPSVDQTFILGHSEGTIHAIKLFEAEKEHQRIDGLMLLAPTGRTLQEIILSQVTHQINKIPLLPQSSKDRALEGFARGLDSIAEGHPKTAEELEIPFYLKKLYNVFCRPDSLAYSQEIFRYDPKEHLSNVDKPVLLVAAGKDLQVDYVKDVLALSERAKARGQDNVQLVTIENSNHVFKHEQKPLNQLGTLDALAYNREGRVVDPVVIDTMRRWLGNMRV